MIQVFILTFLVKIVKLINMSLIESFIKRARASSARIVLPEGNDLRILRAASKIVSEEIAEVILLGDQNSLNALAESNDVSLAGCTVVNPSNSNRSETYAALYADGARPVKTGMATRAVRKPLYYAAMMVRAGDADLMLAGASNPTGRVIEAAQLCIGLADDIKTISSFFIMIPQGRSPMIFADCAVNVDPSAEQLADIAIASAGSAAKLLDDEPRVAMLSFSTHGTSKHEHATKVVRAVELVRERAPQMLIDGELQADSALVSTIAKIKVGADSSVAGQANVLIFPNLDAGNIAYKLVQHLGRVDAIGPILQGFAHPVSDLSRGASVDDIVATAAISLGMR
jgi:phosphate acetyltransferase